MICGCLSPLLWCHGRGMRAIPIRFCTQRNRSLFCIRWNGKGGYKTLQWKALSLTCLLYMSRTLTKCIIIEIFITLLKLSPFRAFPEQTNGEPSETWDLNFLLLFLLQWVQDALVFFAQKIQGQVFQTGFSFLLGPICFPYYVLQPFNPNYFQSGSMVENRFIHPNAWAFLLPTEFLNFLI